MQQVNGVENFNAIKHDTGIRRCNTSKRTVDEMSALRNGVLLVDAVSDNHLGYHCYEVICRNTRIVYSLRCLGFRTDTECKLAGRRVAIS